MKLFIGLSLAFIVMCLLCWFAGYQQGYSWGLRVQQCSALNLPGLVDVYGCGVDRFLRVDTQHCVRLHQVLAQLGPIPATVNLVSLRTNRSIANEYCGTLSEALATNGLGKWPLSGGESILLMHQIK
jgi:hypothetical protein